MPSSKEVQRARDARIEAKMLSKFPELPTSDLQCRK